MNAVKVDTEAELKAKSKKWLDKNGWFNPNIHSEGFYCHKGIADKVAIKGGRVVMIEFKRNMKTSKQSPDQVVFEARWKAHGGEYIIVRSIEELAEKLNGEKQLTI